MPRLRVIILDRPDPGNPRVFRHALWADVPAAQQRFYVNSAATSAWLDATAADLTALRNGSVIEKVDTLQSPVGAGIPQTQVFLQDAWIRFQADVTSSTQWQRYGSTWSSSAAWTLVNIT